jgi:DNA-binding response OmpR family regulator
MNRKICLVEDTPDLLENLSRFLILEGFDVLPCKNGAEALEKLKAFKPDIIITDLWMPVMDGFAFIEAVRRDAVFSHTPIAVFSAAPLQGAEKERLANHVNDYIKKPVAMEELLGIIDRLQKKRS